MTTETDEGAGRAIVAKFKALPGYPWLPCPICNGIEGCDHTVPERARAGHMASGAELERLKRQNAELLAALDESVRLQSHYALLLNQYDGGARLAFGGADAWLQRLDTIDHITNQPETAPDRNTP